MGHERHPRQPDPLLLHTEHVVPLALHGFSETHAAPVRHWGRVHWVYAAYRISQRGSVSSRAPALLRSARRHGFFLLGRGARLSHYRGGHAYTCAGVLLDPDGANRPAPRSGHPSAVSPFPATVHQLLADHPCGPCLPGERRLRPDVLRGYHVSDPRQLPQGQATRRVLLPTAVAGNTGSRQLLGAGLWTPVADSGDHHRGHLGPLRTGLIL